MKKIILFILLLCPLIVQAKTIKELPPTLNIRGINQNDYEITKTITDQEYIIELKEKEGSKAYSWSFLKADIGEVIDLDFTLSFESANTLAIEKLTDIPKTYLSFSHHGNLPSSAKIKIYVGDYYSNGEKLYLYYYNDLKNEIEYVQHNLIVKEGCVEFKINHCSDYFLTTTIVNDATNNPRSMQLIIIVMSTVVLGLASVILFTSKK